MDKNSLERLIDPTGRQCDPARIAAATGLFNLRLADGGRIGEAIALAKRLISPDVMSEGAGVALQRRSQCSFFVFCEEEEVEGFFAVAPLRRAGVAAIESGAFRAKAIDLDEICTPGEAAAGVYLLGAAGRTEPARSAVVRALAAVHEAVFWGVKIFVTIASADGERLVLTRLGFKRSPGDGARAVRAPRERPLQGFEFERAL